MLDTTKAIREESGMEGGTIEDKSGMKTEENGMKGGMIDDKSDTKIKTVDKILDLISKNNIISISQLSEEIGINRSAIQKHIDNLKSKGIICRDGSGKGGK